MAIPDVAVLGGSDPATLGTEPEVAVDPRSGAVVGHGSAGRGVGRNRVRAPAAGVTLGLDGTTVSGSATGPALAGMYTADVTSVFTTGLVGDHTLILRTPGAWPRSRKRRATRRRPTALACSTCREPTPAFAGRARASGGGHHATSAPGCNDEPRTGHG